MRTISFNFRMFVFFLCLGLIALGGCHSKDNEQTTDGNVARSNLVRDTNPQASDADLAAVAAGNTDFALKAFGQIGADADTNTVFSPYSITLAVALATAGARGTTLTGMEQALSFPLPQDRLHPAFNKLDLLLATKTTGTVHSDGSQSPRLNIVNAVWGQQDFPILPAYLDTLAVNYGAGLRIVDFIHAPEDSRSTINSWVADQTNNRITDLIPQGSLKTDTRIILTNAIWFKADWASPFPAGRTANQPFFNRSGSASAVPFMHHTTTLPYAQSNGCQAIDIPYVDGNLSMLVLMPDPGTFNTFLSTLTPTKLDAVTGQLTNTFVDLSLPKFTFTTAADLNAILSSLGMIDAFDPAKADFSGIDGNRDLFVSSVVHQAFISVDEKGTEAAAATAILFGTTSVPPPPLILTIDHPFLFLVRDRQTGLVLFMGKVVTL
jgi:serine protease inhibitor